MAWSKEQLCQVTVLAAVAAGAFLLGRRSAARHDAESAGYAAPGQANAEKPAQAAAHPERDKGHTVRVAAKELLYLFSQLPLKPFGQQRPAHSSAKAVLVCASGKGGVGKSTVAVNLAFSLQKLGLKVGLLDLDVYGPSLPLLVRLPATPVQQNAKGHIVPLDYGGVALMSWGYIQAEAVTVRAPILNQMVAQLLTEVEWGTLDILVVDSPPGTGDVLLSLGQTLPVDGAIIVTTSNHISLADMVKGVQLFDKLRIPPLLVVANMATFYCEGREHELFSDGAATGLREWLAQRGIGLLELPLDPLLSCSPEHPAPAETREYPFVVNPNNANRPAAVGFRRLAHEALEALIGCKEAQRGVEAVKLKLRSGGSLEVRLPSGELAPIECGVLRSVCRCANCVDEFTGEVKVDREGLRADSELKALGVTPVGNYAVQVRWSDGHSSLVALRALEQLTSGDPGKEVGAANTSTW